MPYNTFFLAITLQRYSFRIQTVHLSKQVEMFESCNSTAFDMSKISWKIFDSFWLAKLKKTSLLSKHKPTFGYINFWTNIIKSNVQFKQVLLQPDTVYERVHYQFEDDAYDTVPDLITYYVGSGKSISAASGARIRFPCNRTYPLSFYAAKYGISQPIGSRGVSPLNSPSLVNVGFRYVHRIRIKCCFSLTFIGPNWFIKMEMHFFLNFIPKFPHEKQKR